MQWIKQEWFHPAQMVRKKTRRRIQRTDGLRVEPLIELTDRLFTDLWQMFPSCPLLAATGVKNVRWENIEVVVRTANDKPIKRHHDRGSKGHLLFIYNLGLTSLNTVWPNGRQVALALQSGDLVVFNGLTDHAALRVIENTSPFPNDPWMADRRVGVLVRQRELWNPPGGIYPEGKTMQK